MSAGLIAALLILEMVLRFFPVREPATALPVNDRNPVFRFQPNRDYLWSRGPDFSIATMKHSNNYGFLNSEDYDPQGTAPLVAVIGDSFVEAFQVPNASTFYEGLTRMLGKRKTNGRVYSFGHSGAPMSEYLGLAQYARDTFNPDAMIFVIVGNDFDESLLSIKNAPGQHYFAEKNGHFDLQRIDFSPVGWREALKASYLIRYFYFNCESVWEFFSNPMQSAGNSLKNFAGQTTADANVFRVAMSKKVTDAFLKELPARTGLKTDKILFVVDALRPHLYSEEDLKMAEGSFFDILRTYFIDQVRREGYETIDLQPVFLSRFQATGRRFEFPNDGHWNSEGHQTVASAIFRSGLFTQTFFGERGQDPLTPSLQADLPRPVP